MSDPDGDHTVREIDEMNRREAIRRGVDPGPREHEFAGLGDAALKLGDAMFKDRLQPRPDEMAAGLIHEPGTGGIAGGCLYCNAPSALEHDPMCTRPRPAMDDDRDHCGYVEAESDGEFLARLGIDAAQWARAFIDTAAMANPLGRQLRAYPHMEQADLEATMIGWFANAIEAGRSTGDMEGLRTMIADLHEESSQVTAQLQTTAQQRDFLTGQIDSLVQRLAGAQVAAGLIDMAAAQGFVQKEILPINQVLAQIAAQPQEQ